MDLKALTRFVGSKHEFRLTKLTSTRQKTKVPAGSSQVGDFYMFDWPATNNLPAAKGVEVIGPGLFSNISTSPVVKIIDETEDTTIFQTEGGTYKLERLPLESADGAPV